MLALLLFPIAEKVVHELGHLNDKHCEIKATHFCEQEHHCSICDYIFSSSVAILPNENPQIIAFPQNNFNVFFEVFLSPKTSLKYTLPLRGPPTV